jgi:hypothetical protein
MSRSRPVSANNNPASQPSSRASSANKKKYISQEQRDIVARQLQALARNINKKRKEVKDMRSDTLRVLSVEDSERMKRIELEINELLDLYSMSNNGEAYRPSIEHLVQEFFDDFFFALDSDKRSFSSLSGFYGDICQLTIQGCSECFSEKLPVIQAIMVELTSSLSYLFHNVLIFIEYVQWTQYFSQAGYGDCRC